MHKQSIPGGDGASVTISVSSADLLIEFEAPGLAARHNAAYLALGTRREIGCAILPFQCGQEGSTVFLPFKADLFLYAKWEGDRFSCMERKWERWKWNEPVIPTNNEAEIDSGGLRFQIPRFQFPDATRFDCIVYAKDLSQNDGWGRLFACSDATVEAGVGDKYIPHYHEINFDPAARSLITRRNRLGVDSRMRVYQLFVRLFGNTNETRKQNGTLAENGVGKFNDINDAALQSLREMSFTHLWLTGVLQQGTATDYSLIGQPADDPDLLKGIAGSPYAIKDYFDVCPDYAQQPEKRLEEFKALLARIHAHEMKVLIDFVPNHVARSYKSDVRPELDFGAKGNNGAGDDMSIFFSPQNNFFYLQPDGNGPPLRLPTWKDGHPLSPTCQLAEMKCDGLFEGEMKFGRATGNNVVSWTPTIIDWYETAKLNYGFDFTDPAKNRREYPNANTPDKPIPDTWKKMDRVLAHWQQIGVDGFRCDMAHMVPPEFWNWLIAQARARDVDVVFIGEAYDNDPTKVPGTDPVISKLHDGRSNVMFDLLNAGFNAVYDDPTYRAIKKIYEGPGWANDIDNARPDDFIFENSLRYAENHDEVRIAARSQWNGLGMKVGAPVSAILYGLSRGPAMIYSGQEVGEPAEGLEGFGSNDARTSIFDYWSMPELVKWVNDHQYDGARLSPEQYQLRAFYSRLMKLAGEPAFEDGIFIPLNAANRDNPGYGRSGDEQASGHWLYSFLRYDAQSGQRFLVAANLNAAMTLKHVRVIFPDWAISSLGLPSQDRQLHLIDRLAEHEAPPVRSTIAEARNPGVLIPKIPPLTACYFEISG